jgi:hypothetical protein
MAMILGFLLGIVMVVHQSIWPAVIAHGMFDATSFALVPIALEHLHVPAESEFTTEFPRRSNHRRTRVSENVVNRTFAS